MVSYLGLNREDLANSDVPLLTGLVLAIALFDAVCFLPKDGREMAAMTNRSQSHKPLGLLWFDNDCLYPSWFVRYQRNGSWSKLALSTWDPSDVEGALAEAAKRLHCPSERLRVESRQNSEAHSVSE